MPLTVGQAHTKSKNWLVSIGAGGPGSYQGAVARSIRAAMFDIQEACNQCFRSSYSHAAAEAIRQCRQHNLSQIVELGAGSAPLTKLPAEDPRATGLTLIVSDLIPDPKLYQGLERKYPNRVKAVLDSVDFSIRRDWGPGTLLVLINTFPAIDEQQRPALIRALSESGDRVLMYEASRKTLLSMIITFTALFAGWLTPLAMLRSPGHLRRILWCWLIPIAPLLYIFDGLWWNLRCWTDQEWRSALERENEARVKEVSSTLNTQTVVW